MSVRNHGPGRTADIRADGIRRASPPLVEPRTPGDSRRRVAIVMPAYDEEVSIGPIIRALPRDSTDVRYRVFVCDDGSTDRTFRAAEAAGATVVRHSHNRGIGAALTTGFEAALEWQPDVVVQIDADGQHDPTLIPQLTAPILARDADYVIGSRFLTGAVGLDPVRRVGVRLYTLLVRAFVGLSITDVTSGFRAFRTEAYPRLSIRSENNWALEMTLRAGLNRLRVVEVSTPYLARVGGRSQFAIRRMFVVYHFRVVKQVFRAYTASSQKRGNPSNPSEVSVGFTAPTSPLRRR